MIDEAVGDEAPLMSLRLLTPESLLALVVTAGGASANEPVDVVRLAPPPRARMSESLGKPSARFDTAAPLGPLLKLDDPNTDPLAGLPPPLEGVSRDKEATTGLRAWLPKGWGLPFARRGKADPDQQRSKLLLMLQNRNTLPSDQVLVTRCQQMLRTDRSLAHQAILVEVDKGVIYLRGEVDSVEHRRRAVEVSKRTEGAKNVRDEIQIRIVPQLKDAAEVASAFPNRNGPASAATQEEVVPTTPAVENAVTFPRDDRLDGPAPSVSTQKLPAPTRNGARVIAQSRPTAPPEILPTRAGLPRVMTYERFDESAPKADRPVAAREAPKSKVIPSPKTLGISAPNLRLQGPIPVAAPAELALASPAPVAKLNADAVLASVEPNDAEPIVPVVAGADKNQPKVIASSKGVRRKATNEEPAKLWSSQEVQTDVQRLLQKDPATGGLTFRYHAGEIQLSGSIGSTRELHAVIKALSDLPGVDYVSYDRVEFTRQPKSR